MPYLSGIGCADLRGKQGYAPSDPSKRHDDENYHISPTEDIFHIPHYFDLGWEEPPNVGHPVHQSCWQLLCQWAPVRGVENISASFNARFLYNLFRSALSETRTPWLIWLTDFAMQANHGRL